MHSLALNLSPTLPKVWYKANYTAVTRSARVVNPPRPSGEDFGQKIDLTVRIREILRNYPEGTSILKELVQNADDAGAREVRLCLDLRQHGTDGLPSPALAQFQGPALLVYNDGVFTDTDFRYKYILGV